MFFKKYLNLALVGALLLGSLASANDTGNKLSFFGWLKNKAVALRWESALPWFLGSATGFAIKKPVIRSAATLTGTVAYRSSSQLVKFASHFLGFSFCFSVFLAPWGFAGRGLYELLPEKQEQKQK